MRELLLCRSGLGLVMGKFRQFVLFVHDMIMTVCNNVLCVLFVMPCCIRFSSFPFGIYFNAFGYKKKKKKKKKKNRAE